MNGIFRSVDSDRQVWEDRVNASFAKIRSAERVCFHADCTVTLGDHLHMTECDYCPAWELHGSTTPKIPDPWYFRDTDQLSI